MLHPRDHFISQSGGEDLGIFSNGSTVSAQIKDHSPRLFA
jgi:hypothetical protein